MAQVTIYLDDELLTKTRASAEAAGLSLSAWLAGLVREKTGREWSPEFLALLGSWPDMPLAEELRASDGEDTPRETF